MLLYLRGKISDRKLRLFAVACTAAIRHLLAGECSREVIRFTERWAEDATAGPAVSKATNANYQLLQSLQPYTAQRMATAAVNTAAGPGAWAAAWLVVSDVRSSLWAASQRPPHSVAADQAALLRHIAGKPDCPDLFDPAWRTPEAVAIARAAYDDCQWDDLPILADALEEAGCADEVLLTHCREPGEHVRGCWVLDLVLGKE
jgi:hypothetical protein